MSFIDALAVVCTHVRMLNFQLRTNVATSVIVISLQLCHREWSVINCSWQLRKEMLLPWKHYYMTNTLMSTVRNYMKRVIILLHR